MGVAREEQFLNLSNKVLITNSGSALFKGCSLHLVRLSWFLPTNAIKYGIIISKYLSNAKSLASILDKLWNVCLCSYEFLLVEHIENHWTQNWFHIEKRTDWCMGVLPNLAPRNNRKTNIFQNSLVHWSRYSRYDGDRRRDLNEIKK